MQGVHRLDWLVPITGHKHNDYQNSERSTEQQECLLMCQIATFPGLCLYDCCWHQADPVQKQTYLTKYFETAPNMFGH